MRCHGWSLSLLGFCVLVTVPQAIRAQSSYPSNRESTEKTGPAMPGYGFHRTSWQAWPNSAGSAALPIPVKPDRPVPSVLRQERPAPAVVERYERSHPAPVTKNDPPPVASRPAMDRRPNLQALRFHGERALPPLTAPIVRRPSADVMSTALVPVSYTETVPMPRPGHQVPTATPTFSQTPSVPELTHNVPSSAHAVAPMPPSMQVAPAHGEDLQWTPAIPAKTASTGLDKTPAPLAVTPAPAKNFAPIKPIEPKAMEGESATIEWVPIKAPASPYQSR